MVSEPRYDRSLLRIRDYLACRDQAESFVQTECLSRATSYSPAPAEPERVSAVRVSATLWPMLGFEARAGDFQARRRTRRQIRSVILTTSSGSANLTEIRVLGRTVLLDDRSHTIIGSCAQVEMESMWHDADVFVPFPSMRPSWQEKPDYGSAIVRIKSGRPSKRRKPSCA